MWIFQSNIFVVIYEILGRTFDYILGNNQPFGDTFCTNLDILLFLLGVTHLMTLDILRKILSDLDSWMNYSCSKGL